MQHRLAALAVLREAARAPAKAFVRRRHLALSAQVGKPLCERAVVGCEVDSGCCADAVVVVGIDDIFLRDPHGNREGSLTVGDLAAFKNFIVDTIGASNCVK